MRTATKGAADADAAATNLVCKLSRARKLSLDWNAFCEAQVEADKLASAAKDAVSQANSTKFQFYVPYNASATMVALHAAKVAEVEGRVTLLRAKADFARARVALMRQNVPVGNPKAIFVEAAAIQLETHAAVDLDAAESSAARSLAMMAAANALAEVERAHRSLVHAVIRARAAHDAAGVVRAVGCCSPPRVVRSPR